MFRKTVNLSLFILGIILFSYTSDFWAYGDDYRFDFPDSNIGAYWNPNIPSPTLDLGIRNLNANLYSPSMSFSYLDPSNTSRNATFSLFFNAGVDLYYAGEYSATLKKFETCLIYLAYPDTSEATREEKMYFFLLQSLCYEKLESHGATLYNFQEAVIYGFPEIEANNADNWSNLFLEKIDSKFNDEDKAIIRNLLEESKPYIQQEIDKRKFTNDDHKGGCFIESLSNN